MAKEAGGERRLPMQKVNEHEQKFRGGDAGVKYLFRGPAIDWGILKLLPGQSLGHHYHNRVEETFYFTAGKPRIIVNGTEYRVAEGDAYRLEPGDKHDIINDTDQAMVAIFIKSTYDPEDKVNV
jgi:quercetin dioxygenase-like cupin family protein